MSSSPARSAARGSHLLVLGLILTCQLMIVLDVSIVTTALPRIHTSLHFSAAGLSWVQNAYTLTFGGLLLLGARAGDLLGRRRMFAAGISLFSAASLAGGLATSPTWLLASRAVQGVGAAIAAPAALTLLTTSFGEGHARHRAIALYSGVSGAGGSVGLVLGGLLTDALSWRWGMFINVPIGVALVTLAPRVLPETARRAGRFDLTGALASTLGVTALVYGFVRAASDGWGDRVTVGAFTVAVLLLAAFVATERHAEQPVTPPRLFASRERSGAYVARIFVVGGMFSLFFFMTQFLQGVLGYSPLRAGVAFLPMTVVLFATVQVVPRIVGRVGAQAPMVGGLTVALAGVTWLSRLTEATGFFPHIAVAMVLLGVGVGLAFGPLTAAGISGVAPEDAGAASGLVNVAHQLGGALGLGVLVTVFSSAARAAADGGARHELAHATASAVSGSAVFLTLALAVVVLVIGRPRTDRIKAEVREGRGARLATAVGLRR